MAYPTSPHRRGTYPLKRLSFAGLALAAVGLLAAGCSSSGNATPSAPSKATYDKQASAICNTYSSKLSTLGASLQSSTSPSQAERVLSRAISLGQQGTSKLEALTRPSGEASSLSAAYNEQEQQVTELKHLLSAIRANNQTEFKSDELALNASDASVNQKFDALGLTTCGSGSGSS
jgi:hypothetical protein